MKCAESALVVFLYVFDHACFGTKRIQRKFDPRRVALSLAQRVDEGLLRAMYECLSLEKEELRCAEEYLFLDLFARLVAERKKFHPRFDILGFHHQSMYNDVSMEKAEGYPVEKKELRFAEGYVFLFPDPFDHRLLRMNLMQREKVWEKVMLWADDATLILNHRISRRSV